MDRYYKLSTSDGKYYCYEEKNKLYEYFSRVELLIENNNLIFNMYDNKYYVELLNIEELSEEDFQYLLESMLSSKNERSRSIKRKIVNKYKKI